MKLDLICGRDQLRPTMLHVLVTLDVCVATNAFVIGVVPSDLIFSRQFLAELPEGGIMIHWEDWKKLSGATAIIWNSPKIIEAVYKGGKRNALIKVETSASIGHYPNWKAVMPGRETEAPVDAFGVNPAYLLDLQKALGLEDGVKLTFTGPNRGALVTCAKGERTAYGLIMNLKI